MPTTTTRPRARTMAKDWVSDSDVPTQSKTTSAPVVNRPANTNEPAWRRTARASWSGDPHRVGPQLLGRLALVRVLGPDQDRARNRRAHHMVEGGHGGQAQGSRTDHRHHIAGLDAGGQGGVHRARR